MRRYVSLIIGEDCNARCPFCIAPPNLKRAAEPFPVQRALDAAHWARTQGAKVASVSGGGEPLMFAAANPDAFNTMTTGLAELFDKRDLHSNYAVPVGIRKANLYPAYTDLTVSLWPNATINRTYLNTHTFERTVAALRAEADQSSPRRLRLSATLGTDWARSIDDIRNYVTFAASLGASAITLRPLITPPAATHEQSAWIAARRLDGADVSSWLHDANVSVQSTTVRGAEVFDIDGVAVCVYRYAIEDSTEDRDFYYFRPSTENGRYGLFTDYHHDLRADGSPSHLQEMTPAA